MLTGRLTLSIPSRLTLVCDIHLAYNVAFKHIQTLLKKVLGRIHYETDAWTSPNHCAFIGYIAHFYFQGQIHNFPIDMVEVP